MPVLVVGSLELGTSVVGKNVYIQLKVVTNRFSKTIITTRSGKLSKKGT